VISEKLIFIFYLATKLLTI